MKGAMVKVVLKCNGIWIANGKFGCTWRAQIRVKVPEGGLRDYAILSDLKKKIMIVEKSSNSSNEQPMMLEDLDEEEEVEQEPVLPEPEPEPKKKVL